MDASRFGSRIALGRACLWLGGALSAAIIPLSACGGNPAQIIDYSPLRGSVDVSTAEPIRVSFDHAVDQASVASRFHLTPATDGRVRWLSGRELVYDHPTLRTSTTYQVIIDAGYRDAGGNVYSFRHRWSFVTQAPPSLVGSTPSSQDAGVDPAAYLTLEFTRQMDPVTLRSALSFNPSTPFDVRLDPADGRRAIIAPAALLAPNTSYQLSVGVTATDAAGNQLDLARTIAFTTGDARALRHWIAFVTAGDQPAGALWIVDESGFPRQLYGASPVHSFSWSPSGDRLIVHGDSDTWSVLTPGVGSAPLTFTGPWAAALASGMGYVYIDETGTLRRQRPDGKDEVIATDVSQASVGPGGLRVAFISPSSPDEIWGYDVGLRARYQLALDTGPLSGVAWAPAGNRIAYLRQDQSALSLRVRNFSGAGSTVTVATGDLGAPAWMPDSNSVVFAAAVTPGAAQHKALVVNVAAPPAPINPQSAGLPPVPGIDVESPVPSPDGHQIAFLNAGQVWLMNADGTRPTALTRKDPDSFPYSCLMPAWTRS